MLKIVAGLLTLFISLPLYAQTDEDTLWYEVEIIIFEHHQQPEKMTEIWPADPGTPNYKRSQLLSPPPIDIETVESEITEQLLLDSGTSRIFLASPQQWHTSNIDATPAHLLAPLQDNALSNNQSTAFETPGTDTLNEMLAFQDNTTFQTGFTVDLVDPRPDEIIAFQMLKDKELFLIEDYRRLLKSELYTPRMHFGWRQPITTDAKSLPVLVFRDMLEQETTDMMETEEELPEDNLSDETGLTNSAPSEELSNQNEPFRNGNIEGTITLSAGNYLHIKTDLLYFNQSQPPREGFSFFGALKKDISPDVYRITQSRRVKASEVHYFDHPMFGVLTVVRPYELPKDEDELLEPE